MSVEFLLMDKKDSVEVNGAPSERVSDVLEAEQKDKSTTKAVRVEVPVETSERAL